MHFAICLFLGNSKAPIVFLGYMVNVLNDQYVSSQIPQQYAVYLWCGIVKFNSTSTSLKTRYYNTFHFNASVFLQTFEITDIMFHIVNMLKTRVYLDVPALFMTSTSPPAFK